MEREIKLMTYKDIYKFPLSKEDDFHWVWDNEDNFVFQFEINDDRFQNNVLEILNGERKPLNNKNIFSHKEGLIMLEDKPVITIRGWGNLTGSGAHKLSGDNAANIQDTFAEYIIETLNK